MLHGKKMIAGAALAAATFGGGAQAATIAEVVAANNQFTILNAALQATGWDTILNSAGPFTVFAPTDEAFRSVGITPQTLQAMGPRDAYRFVANHVVWIQVPYADVANVGTQITSSSLHELQIYGPGVFQVENATVVQTDIGADNGIIHVIDEPLLR